MTDLSLAHRALAPAARPTRTEARPAGPGPLLSFETLFDAVNPLQHLPVVSTVYRAASGDAIGVPARLAGSFLFGGPLGLLAGAATVAFEAVTGGSIVDHATAALGRLSGDAPEETAAALPWLKPEAPAGTPPGPASAQSVVMALDRLRMPEAGQAAPVEPDPAPGLAPETVAHLYALEATRGDRP
jgi:hypothetical protein